MTSGVVGTWSLFCMLHTGAVGCRVEQSNVAQAANHLLSCASALEKTVTVGIKNQKPKIRADVEGSLVLGKVHVMYLP